MNYVINEENRIRKIIEKIREINPSKILIQSPAGLKNFAIKVSDELNNIGIPTIISANPCYGGCDVAFNEAKNINANLILHIGHSKFLSKHEVRTLYYEYHYKDFKPLENTLRKAIPLINGRNIGIAVTIQWIEMLKKTINFLKEYGINGIIGKKCGLAQYNGQIIGCDYSTAKIIEKNIDSYIVIGSIFHALGLKLITEKNVIAIEPFIGKTLDMGDLAKKVLTQRYMKIQEFKKAKKIGILICLKPGQKNIKMAEKLKEIIKKNNKESSLITINEIENTRLEEMNFDAYINTCCPRVSIDDQSMFKKPLLLPSELLIALNYLEWEKTIYSLNYLHPFKSEEK
ncbi:MAG: diphthamide biosynthesis enzyme Dph2 [Nitrososphaerota archaeon]